MSKRRHKHNPSVPNGRFLQSARLEQLLYGEATPDAERRAAKEALMSAGAREALMHMERARAQMGVAR